MQYSSIKALHDHLKKEPYLLTYKINDQEASVETVLIASSSKTNHLLIFDKELVNKFDNENDMFVDGTFKVKPNVQDAYQLLTIMCKKHDTVRLNLIIFSTLRAQILFDTRTRDASRLVSILNSRHSPEKIISLALVSKLFIKISL